MKGIGIIRKLSNVLPRKPLITIYKSFVRPQLDYGDLIYMIRQIMIISVIELKVIMLPFQTLVLLKEHLDLSLLSLGDVS